MQEKIKNRRKMPMFLKILLGAILICAVFLFIIGTFFVVRNESYPRFRDESYSRHMDTAAGFVGSTPMTKAMPRTAKSMLGGTVNETMPILMPTRDVTSIPNIDKKIIKNGSIELKVDDAEKVAKEINDIVKKLGGDIFSVNSRRQANGSLIGALIIKVPVNKFDEAINNIKKVGEKVIFESVNANDATMDYIDLKAQLDNKKAEEQTFKKLLDRSGNLKDILSVTKELTRVRSEVDSLEGQLKYMTAQTDMATINVTLTEFVQISTDRDSWKPWRTVTKSLHNLILNSQNFVDGLIRFVILQLPILIVVVLLIFGGYKGALKIYRKIRK